MWPEGAGHPTSAPSASSERSRGYPLQIDCPHFWLKEAVVALRLLQEQKQTKVRKEECGDHSQTSEAAAGGRITQLLSLGPHACCSFGWASRCSLLLSPSAPHHRQQVLRTPGGRTADWAGLPATVAQADLIPSELIGKIRAMKSNLKDARWNGHPAGPRPQGSKTMEGVY